MQKAIGAVFVTALLASAAYAASPTNPSTPTAPQALPSSPSAGTTTFVLASADENKLRDWVTMQKTVSIAAPAGTTIAVGSNLPASVMLYSIPATAGIANIGMNQYAVVGDKIVLVNPSDRKIVYVVSSAGQQTAQNQAGTQAGGIVIQQPAPTIRLDQPPPQVTVQPGQANVTVKQPQPEIIVQQAAPTITVDIPPPQITVRMPKPEVNVAQALPQVQVTQPPPQVQVTQPQQQAQVNVQPSQAQVNVAQGSNSSVDVQQLGQPTIRYERAEPKVTITQQQAQPTVKFEQLDQTAAADQRQLGPTAAPSASAPSTAATPNRTAAANPPATANPPAAAPSAIAPASPSALPQFQNRQVAVADLKGIDVVNRNNDKLGTVDHLATGPDNKTFIVLSSGGFLGIGERKVLVPLENAWMNGKQLVTDLTNDQIKTMPELKADNTTTYKDFSGQTLQVRVQ